MSDADENTKPADEVDADDLEDEQIAEAAGGLQYYSKPTPDPDTIP